jgi:uncharacterized protein YukE
MSGGGTISYPVEEMRQVAQQIGSLSDDLQQLTDNLWKQIDDALTNLPAPIKTVLEIVIQYLKRDLNHLLHERSELARNLKRVADLAQQLDQGVSQGFNSAGIIAGVIGGAAAGSSNGAPPSGDASGGDASA